MSNIFKTALLLGALTILLVLIGGAIGGQQGMLVAFVLALGMNFFSYWFSDKMVLAMYRAKPIEESQAPALYRIVRPPATRGGIPPPRVPPTPPVKHRDVLIGAIAAPLAGAITSLAHMAQWAMIFGGRRDDEEEGGGVL